MQEDVLVLEIRSGYVCVHTSVYVCIYMCVVCCVCMCVFVCRNGDKESEMLECGYKTYGGKTRVIMQCIEILQTNLRKYIRVVTSTCDYCIKAYQGFLHGRKRGIFSPMETLCPISTIYIHVVAPIISGWLVLPPLDQISEINMYVKAGL